MTGIHKTFYELLTIVTFSFSFSVKEDRKKICECTTSEHTLNIWTGLSY